MLPPPPPDLAPWLRGGAGAHHSGATRPKPHAHWRHIANTRHDTPPYTTPDYSFASGTQTRCETITFPTMPSVGRTTANRCLGCHRRQTVVSDRGLRKHCRQGVPPANQLGIWRRIVHSCIWHLCATVVWENIACATGALTSIGSSIDRTAAAFERGSRLNHGDKTAAQTSRVCIA